MFENETDWESLANVFCNGCKVNCSETILTCMRQEEFEKELSKEFGITMNEEIPSISRRYS